ncbi:hypothetical protein ZHAS_00014008 [Anopheles sinensis]|uniref:Uncharacterized protein n=1 Tax=Anopheles sinensis TaxID=74873 RepID=A0A084W6Y1_ANOSI|nr:hypothetical protein ZHAS_00014008 [Anopheles sinensis]
MGLPSLSNPSANQRSSVSYIFPSQPWRLPSIDGTPDRGPYSFDFGDILFFPASPFPKGGCGERYLIRLIKVRIAQKRKHNIFTVLGWNLA